MFEFLVIISVSTLTKCFFMDLKYGAEYSGHTGLTFKEARPMESEKTALKQLRFSRVHKRTSTENYSSR